MMAVEHQGRAACFKGLPDEVSGATSLTTNDDGDSCNSQEPVEKQPRLDFKIMNDGTIQVKEHCGAGCSENNEALQAGPQDQFHKDAVQVDAQGNEATAHLPQQAEEQAKLPSDITLQIFPSNQDIHLVTTSSMLSTDITTFSTQVPSILTEGDEEDTDAQGHLTEQLHVVTTSNILSQAVGSHLVVQAAPVDAVATQCNFEQTSVLRAPQQVLIAGMIVDSGNADQPVSVAMPTRILQENSAQDAEGLEGGHACPHADCNTVCAKAHKLKLHMLSHSGERAYKCPMEGCGWSFATSYKLKRHLRGHTGERPFACDFEGCGKHFTTAYNLKAHVRAHYQANTILCTRDGCSQAFPTLHKLQVHERKHQLEERPFACHVEGCARVFTTASALTTHIRTHSVDRAHACAVAGCGKTFTKASKLKLHLRSHTGERPFGCEVPGCAWTFTSAYKLKRHMRKHTGERPFTCHFPACTKSFTRSSHLKTHLRVHTGERPHACPVEGCSKSFTAGSTLSVHMRKHTGEKPFKCDVEGCSKAYTTAANLRAHKKRHEGHNGVDQSNQAEGNAPTGELVVSGAMLSESEAEVTYTTIQTFSEDFGSDVTPLPAGCVQFTPSTSGLCALVTSAENPLISSSADSQGSIQVRVRAASQLDDAAGEGIASETVHLPLQAGEQFVNVSLEDGTRIDVTEFVVRSEESETGASRTRQRSESSDAGGATPKMAGCGFDLSISSMMRHLRSGGEPLDGGARAKEHVTPHAPLDLRSAEEQFAPPAVIFQDEILKTPEQENDSTVVPRSPETPTRAATQQALRISMPHDALQTHLPQTLEPAMAADLEKISGPNPLSAPELTFGSPPSLPETPEEHELCKDALPEYIDNPPSSAEQDEASADSYPESTINLQDLR